MFKCHLKRLRICFQRLAIVVLDTTERRSNQLVNATAALARTLGLMSLSELVVRDFGVQSIPNPNISTEVINR